MSLPSYASPGQRLAYVLFVVYCALVLLFLILPILVIVPLSFNAEPFFTFTPGMLSLDPAAFSLRWYWDLVENPQWGLAVKNSLIIGVCATILAMVLGTTAALGLARREMPARGLIMGVLISPMIVPVIIAATGMYFFYAQIGLTQTLTGIVLAHTALGTPFVVITVTATLSGYDRTLDRAAASLGANPVTTFFKVTMPVIMPGVISGGLFAFITSFDEVVVALFLAGYDQRTIPRQMWSGIREQLSPTILAIATLLILVSILLLGTLELLRRRNARMRGLRA